LEKGKVVDFTPLGDVKEQRWFEILRLRNFSETPWRISSSVLDANFLSVPELREYLANNAHFADNRLAVYRTQLAYRWALGIGYKVSDKVTSGQTVPLWLKGCFYIGRWLALDNVRRMIRRRRLFACREQFKHHINVFVRRRGAEVGRVPDPEGRRCELGLGAEPSGGARRFIFRRATLVCKIHRPG
jgi:hypothetical protein